MSERGWELPVVASALPVLLQLWKEGCLSVDMFPCVLSHTCCSGRTVFSHLPATHPRPKSTLSASSSMAASNPSEDEAGGSQLSPSDFAPAPGPPSPLPVAGHPVHFQGQRQLTKLLCLVPEGRGDVCVLQEDGGQLSPPAKSSLQRKGHLRLRWQAQHGHHSPARLAPGPCHMEQRGVSPTAWPRLPLTPTVYAHRGP